jgi:ABC-2 type transport system permease protein
MTRRRRPATMHSIYERSMREERRSILGWLAGLVGFSVVMLAMYPTVSGNKSFSKLLDAYPDALKKLFSLSDYTTGAGYLRTEVFSFMAPLLLAILAILWGSDLVAGEEERRTIDILLANPVSRRRVVTEKWLALVTGVTLLSAGLELALGLLGPAFRLHVGWAPLTAVVLGSGLFALAFGTLALATGAATGSRGVARGVATVLAVATYLLSTLAQLVGWLRPVESASLWYHALGTDPLSSGFHLGHLLVPALAAAALAGLAVLGFERRDLAT